jgi:hypothetical protein
VVRIHVLKVLRQERNPLALAGFRPRQELQELFHTHPKFVGMEKSGRSQIRWSARRSATVEGVHSFAGGENGRGTHQRPQTSSQPSPEGSFMVLADLREILEVLEPASMFWKSPDWRERIWMLLATAALAGVVLVAQFLFGS